MKKHSYDSLKREYRNLHMKLYHRNKAVKKLKEDVLISEELAEYYKDIIDKREDSDMTSYVTIASLEDELLKANAEKNLYLVCTIVLFVVFTLQLIKIFL